METQTSIHTGSYPGAVAETAEFAAGSLVIYSMHGRCQVLGIEDRQMGSESIRFYKLEVQKATLSRSTRPEPAIWVPVSTARERGLRVPMGQNALEDAFKILGTREYYFQANESWSVVQPKLEATIRTEGGIGMAKVLSYLHVLKRKQVVASTEVNRMNETVLRLFIREANEILRQTSKIVEERINRALRNKLLPDH